LKLTHIRKIIAVHLFEKKEGRIRDASYPLKAQYIIYFLLTYFPAFTTSKT